MHFLAYISTPFKNIYKFGEKRKGVGKKSRVTYTPYRSVNLIYISTRNDLTTSFPLPVVALRLETPTELMIGHGGDLGQRLFSRMEAKLNDARVVQIENQGGVSVELYKSGYHVNLQM